MQPVLETPRLILRPFCQEDLEDFYQYAKHPEVGPAAGWKPHSSREESHKILNDFMAKEEVWAVVLKETGKAVGSIGIHPESLREECPEIRMLGYVLSAKHWGKGLMTEGARRMVAYAFEEMGVSLLSIHHYPFNSRSKRVIEKCGFAYEGTLRMSVQRYDGVWLDRCCYSMTKEEYFAAKGKETAAPAGDCRKKGRILFLNGVTSSGKTSIVDALQAREDRFFYVLANDLFQETVGEKYLRQDYWKYLSEAVFLMYRTAKLFSDRGRDVIIDGILVERPELSPHYQRMLEILKDNPLDIVEVSCPLEICRQRNLARGDRQENQSQEQAGLMAQGIRYSCTVETDKNTPEECGEQIMACLFGQKEESR